MNPKEKNVRNIEKRKKSCRDRGRRRKRERAL
jgi:hypothetical protein